MLDLPKDISEQFKGNNREKLIDTWKGARSVLSRAHVERRLKQWDMYEIGEKECMNMQGALTQYKCAEYIVANYPVYAAGGIFTRHMLGSYSHSADMDFFFVSDKETDMTNVLANIIEYISDQYGDYKCVRNARCTTVIVKDDRYRAHHERIEQHYRQFGRSNASERDILTGTGILRYQFVHRIFPNPISIIGGFDIPAGMIIYGVFGSALDFRTNTLGNYFIKTGNCIVDISRQSKSMNMRLRKYQRTIGAELLYPSAPFGIHDFALNNSITNYTKRICIKCVKKFWGDGECPSGIMCCPLCSNKCSIISEEEYACLNKSCYIKTLGPYNKHVKPAGVKTIYSSSYARDIARQRLQQQELNSGYDPIDPTTHVLINNVKYGLLGDVDMVCCTGEFNAGFKDPVITSSDADKYTDSVSIRAKYGVREISSIYMALGKEWVYGKEATDLPWRVFRKTIDAAREDLKSIKWIINNPWNQWTASFNPLDVTPSRVYGNISVLMPICIPSQVETVLRLGNLCHDSPLGRIDRHLFRYLLAFIARVYYEHDYEVPVLRQPLSQLLGKNYRPQTSEVEAEHNFYNRKEFVAKLPKKVEEAFHVALYPGAEDEEIDDEST